MKDDAAVPEAVVESDRKVLKRIRQREERGGNSPWKWQLVDLISKLQETIADLSKKVEKLDMRNETARKLSEAGKKSAAARKAKFGSAAPPRASAPVLEKAAEPIPDAAVIVKPSGERVPATDLLGEPLPEPVRKKAKKKSDGPTPGAAAWEAYHTAFLKRHGVEPLRNARANKHCSDLVALVGAQRAIDLVRYYVGRSDATYLKAKHPLGLLILDAQKLNTELQTGKEMTHREALRQETVAVNDQVMRQYAANQEQFAEPVREQVRVKEDENAASGTLG